MNARSTTTTTRNKVIYVGIATAFLLLIPLVAMQLTDDVVWTPIDFITAGILLFGTGLAYVLATRNTRSIQRRLVIGAGLATTLFLIWAELAVGIFD